MKLPSVPFRQPVMLLPLPWLWSLGMLDVDELDVEFDGCELCWLLLGVWSCATATAPASNSVAVRLRTFRIESPPCLPGRKVWEVA